MLAGLPGTGKSTLAKELARHVSSSGMVAVVLNKDDVRAALFPGDATDYSHAQNDLCMDMLLRAADYLRHKPDPPRYIFFDGRTFSRAAQLHPVIAAAEAGASAWRILHLVCPADVAQGRLANQARSHPAANRNFELYRQLQARFEPIQSPHLVLDTSEPFEDCLEKAVEYLGVT